jgi:hypothetical protein
VFSWWLNDVTSTVLFIVAYTEMRIKLPSLREESISDQVDVEL